MKNAKKDVAPEEQEKLSVTDAVKLADEASKTLEKQKDQKEDEDKPAEDEKNIMLSAHLRIHEKPIKPVPKKAKANNKK